MVRAAGPREKKKMQDLLSRLFSTPAVADAFSDTAQIRAMARFESALAAAEATTGIVPREAAEKIAGAAARFDPDLEEIAEKARDSGNLAIPFVAAFTETCPESVRGYVHWGATSQDVLDTAFVLQLRAAGGPLGADIDRLVTALAHLSERHRDTPMPGRTLMQPALPITLGFKAAGWLDTAERCARHLDRAFDEAMTVQFGGAVGTLSALGDEGPAVRAALARHLDLHEPEITWHGGRDRFTRLACEVVQLMAALAKMSHDVALLMQAEIGEAREPEGPGRGGSSTMPQKRNPVAAPGAIAAYHAAQGALSGLLSGQIQEHERGLGGWHAEWLTLPEILRLLAGALSHTAETMEGLEVDEVRMRTDLELGHGTMMSEALMMKLAATMGRGKAKALVGELARRAISSERPLAEVAKGDPRVTEVLAPEEINEALAPENYLGMAPSAVDAVVARARRKEKKGEGR